MKTFSYVPHTEADRKKMLDFLGVQNVSELFQDIPEAVQMQRGLDLIPAMSEMELNRHMAKLASMNKDSSEVVSFLGAGVYEHYQPSVVDAMISRSEFFTAYTPYQPEISQGMLQAIFEYQTMVSELTGMDMANASMYDGPTALAEAGIVCCSHTRRSKLLVARTMHPEYRAVLATYAAGQSIDVVEIPEKDGAVDLALLKELCTAEVAGVLIQYPNFFGTVEDLATIAKVTHENGSLLVVNTYPIALGLLKSPGELGADIVVAEGQSLGNLMSFGGPYLGIMATRQELMRKMPGRIVGQTTDSHGRRGFVLTLQAREQHIRRDKASSNICSNQALNALAATIFLSYMGKQGMRELALQNYHKAHYLKDRLSQVNGVEIVFGGPFFNEFVIRVSKPTALVQEQLLEKGYLFGLNLGDHYAEYSDCILLNATELRTRDEIERVCKDLEVIL